MNIFLLLCVLFNTGEFPISTATGRQWYPAMAFGEDRYLVVWEDNRKTGNYLNNDIWGQFVSKTGTLIDTNFPICKADSAQWMISIAYGDSNYMVVWEDRREATSCDIWGQLVAKNGTLINAAFCISNTNIPKINPIIVWGKTRYLVIYLEVYDTDSSRIRGRFILPDGTLDGNSFPIVSKGWNQSLDLAFDGTNYLVVWNKWWSKSVSEVYGQLIDSTGSLIDTSFRIIEGGNSAMSSTVGSNGNNYLVVADNVDGNLRTILGQIVGLDRTLMGSSITVATESTTTRGIPAVGWNGNKYLTVWLDARNGDGDVYGQWFSPVGSLLGSNFQISNGPAFECNTKIAFGDSTGLVIWSDTRGSDYDIYGRIISETGIEERQPSVVSGQWSVTASPNPFVGNTVISYSGISYLEDKYTNNYYTNTRLTIYDIAGKLVETHPITPLPNNSITKIAIGQNLKSGIYFVKVTSVCHLGHPAMAATERSEESNNNKPIKIIKMSFLR